MIGELDIDLEELESRLYSQVYHSSENCENENAVPNVHEGPNTVRAQSLRYFRTGIGSKRNIQNENITLRSKHQAADFFNNDRNAADSTTTIATPNQVLPSVMQMVNPCSNIVIPPDPTHIISNGEFVPTGHMNANLEKYLDRQSRRRLKAIKWQQKRREKRQRIKVLKAEASKFNSLGSDGFTMHYLNESNISPTNKMDDASIVTISDSESDNECVEIPQKKEIIILSDNSEAEEDKKDKIEINKSKENITKIKGETMEQNRTQQPENAPKNDDDDDVLIIDDIPKDLEVIDIDCDVKSVTNTDDNKISSSIKSFETNSTNSNLQKTIRKGTINLRDRNELLRTPDSASTSNDFLDNGVELHQRRFNFSLHGNDFSHPDVFVKPKSNSEMYESESSCSASETNAPVKNNVFNVVDFETPQKDLFNQGDFEVFSDYITPTRDSAEASGEFKQVTTRASSTPAKRLKGEFSDTSSESDYDTNKPSSSSAKKKKLPDLTSVNSQSPNKVETENSTTKRKKYNNSEDSTAIRKKKSKNDKSLTESSSSISVININDTTLKDKSPEVSQTLPKGELDESSGECEVSKIYFVLSDDETGDGKEVKTDIQLVNCKSKDRAPPKVREPDKSCNFSNYWTTDMNKFHNSSWGLENFSAEEIKKTMSDDQKLWKIVEEDRQFNRLSTHRGPRCYVCRDYGHIAFNCPNGRRPIICTLCGQNGHLEPRCPNGLCTLCGCRGGYGTYCSNCANWFTIRCRICRMVGHIDIKCPDLWRRYHLTTEPGPIVRPLKVIQKNPKDRWCSGCARSGHYEYKCRLYSRSHHSVDPNVHEYRDLYNFPKDQPFLIRCDSSHPATPDKTPEKMDKSRSIVEVAGEPVASTSKNIAENTETRRRIDNSDVDVVVIFNESSINNDLNRPGTSSETPKPKEERQMHIPLDTYVFPPVEMIPPYFRGHMGYGTENTTPIRSSDDSQRFLRNPLATPTFKPPQNRTSTPKSTGGKQKKVSWYLNARQYGFAQSQRGMHFINQLHSQLDVEIQITKSEVNAPYTEGTIEIYGSAHDVEESCQELSRFLKLPPRISMIPRFSRAASSFLLAQIQKAERMKGNSRTLYKNLKELQMRLRTAGDKVAVKNDIRFTKIRLNMMLFGKLGLGDGKGHMEKLRVFQRTFAESDDFKIPFCTLYDVMESYSFIFLDTIAHQYERYCAIENPTIKEMRSVANYYRIVVKKCRDSNMSDKLEELERFKASLYNQFTTKAYKGYMTYCHRLLHSIKNQNS